MKDILIKYIDKEIGINYTRPFKIESARLVAANETHFSIVDQRHPQYGGLEVRGVGLEIEEPLDVR